MSPLSARDHNRIVAFVKRNALAILADKSIQKGLTQRRGPTPTAFLKIAARLHSTDARTKESIGKVLLAYRFMARLAGRGATSTPAAEALISSVRKAKSLAEVVQILERAKSSIPDSRENIGLRTGIEVALEMLRLGKDNIYRG